MPKYSHQFVENYTGFQGFGLDRESDEGMVICFLQMFSDDSLMKNMIKKMTDAELEEIFNLISRLLRNHLTEPEYHALFLKDDHDG